MKLFTKLVSVILVAVFIVVLFMQLVTVFVTQESLESQIANQLGSIAEAKENQINDLLKELVQEVEIIATHREFSFEELEKIAQIAGEEFYELFLLDSEGKTIISSDESHVGLDHSENFYFSNARDKTYIKPAHFSETSNKESISISTPHNEGVLVARIDLTFFDTIVSVRTGLGETGESLLAYPGKDGAPVFFTERRFSQNGYGGEGELLPIEEALVGKEEIFFDLHDYRGVEVVSATRYIDDLNLGLVTKIDVEEAFSDISDLKQLMFFIVLAVLVIMGIVIFVLTRSVSKEISILTNNVNQVSKGDLEIKLEKSNIF